MARGFDLLKLLFFLSITLNSPCSGQEDSFVAGPPPTGIRCYTGLKTTGEGLNEDARNITQCDADYSCVSASANVFQGMEEVNIEIGKCIPSLICRNFACEHILDFLPDSADVVSCNISCCDEDLCNQPKVEILEPAVVEEGPPPTGIRCYTGLKTTGEGLNEDARNITQCDADYSCLSASANVFQGMEEVNIEIGKCIPSSICRNFACEHILDFLPDSADVVSCNISCCDEDLCNQPKVEILEPAVVEEVACPWNSWTGWFNNDHDAEDGDDETIESLRSRYPGDICRTPTGFQARSAVTRIPYNPTDINILADVDSGFECLGFPDLPCEDHEIRFCCPEELPPSTTASTTSSSTVSSTTMEVLISTTDFTKPETAASCPNGWTEWINNDRDVDDGDDETIQSIQANNPGLLCDQPTDFQARDSRTLESYDPNLFNVFTGVDLGLECLSFSTLQCKDYEIRFCCPPVVSSTTSAATTTTHQTFASILETTAAVDIDSFPTPAATTASSSEQQQSTTPSANFCPPNSWTPWYNNDVNMEDGDDETLQSLQARYPELICDNPTTFEARSVRTRRPFDESAFNVFAGVDVGLECLAFPSLPCEDHEIRFCCPRVLPSSTTMSPSTRMLIGENTTVAFTTTSSVTMTTQTEDQTSPEVTTSAEASTLRSTATPTVTPTATSTVTSTATSTATSPATEPPTSAQTTKATTLATSAKTTTSPTEATTVTTEISTTTATSTVTQPVTTSTAGLPFFFYEDLNFLPSCTVSHAITSIFRCEEIFTTPTVYNGPLTCRSNIEKVIGCIRSQVDQCLSGGGRNILDTFGFSLFNSKQILALLDNLTARTDDIHETNIQTFCYHAALNFPFPHRVEARLDGCENNALDLLLSKTMEVYSKYTWARNRNDICRAFQKFKQWFVETASEKCDFSGLTSYGYDANAARYLSALTRVVMNTLDNLDLSAC